MTTTNVQVNLDFPSGIVLGGDFAGAYSSIGSVQPGANASFVTVLSSDSTGGPADWHFRFAYSSNPNYRTSVKTPLPAGPVAFSVVSGALSSLAWTMDSRWVTAFPAGIPVGTKVTLAGGSLPSGLSAATPYYVVTTAVGSFGLSATAGGSVITCGGTGSGTFTVTQYNYTGLLAASNARSTTNPASLPFPSGTASQGYVVTADDNGSPIWTPSGSLLNNLSGLTNTSIAQANLGVVGVFNPMSYGAIGDGTTDDTTALQACVAAAISVQGVVDFGHVNYRTTSPITINGQVKMRGSVGYTKGGIVNSASDIFTVTNGANVVVMESCSFTSQAGGGHIFQASNANVSDWTFSGTWCQQSNATKGIWYQYQGGMFDFVVDDNCFWQCAAGASVSPVSFLAMPGNCNGIKFGRGRYTGHSDMVVPWFVFYPDGGAHVDTGIVGFTSGSLDSN